LGKKREAFFDLRQAARVIRDMRLNLPFGDALQVSSESIYDDVFSLLTEVSAELYEETKDRFFLRTAFLAARENRAVSLRSRIDADTSWKERLPPEYWSKLGKLRLEEIRMLRESPSRAFRSSPSLRVELTAMESLAHSGPIPLTEESVERTQARLQPTELLILFHLGVRGSYRFTLTRSSLSLHRLPSQQTISNGVTHFRRLIEKEDGHHVDQAHLLYRQLFADIPDSSGAHWTIVPDEILFQLPFAALVRSRIPRLEYLVERHPVQLIPAVFSRKTKSLSSRSAMVLVGDPVSNRADSRFIYDRVAARGRSSEPLEFPRLAGSAIEIERCRRAWVAGPRRSLTGPEISLKAIQEYLRPDTLVLHLATHVYLPPGAKPPNWNNSTELSSPVITLGLKSDGWSVLTDSEITVLAAPAFVVMSGCGSGRGALAPGTGLLGLTRAWLMAGSQSVVASLWPVLDDTGQFFEDYYRELQRLSERSPSRRSAQALAAAQVKSLRRQGSGRGASQWAAYFSIGVL
jgi:CHAT domain-containing protein